MKNQIGAMAIILSAVLANPLEASVTSRVIREAVEYTSRKFGKEVAEVGVEKLSSRMAWLASKHGDDVVSAAFRKVGPKASRILTEAGEQADTAVRLLARHGDEGASLAMRPSSLNLISRFGDEGADALVRHGNVGETLIGQFAEGGVKALNQVTPQNGRRLAMLAGDGMAKPELFDVVCRYGDRACEFVWANKGALAIGSTMAMFISNPEPFLEGTTKLTELVADSAIRPLAEEAGRHYGGTILIFSFILVAAAMVYLRLCTPGSSSVMLARKLLLQRLSMRRGKTLAKDNDNC